MSSALDRLLEAAADLSVAEMREMTTGVRSRLDPRVPLREADVLLALNEGGVNRKKQRPAVGPLPLPGAVTYMPPTEAQATHFFNVDGKLHPVVAKTAAETWVDRLEKLPMTDAANKYSPPTLDDVKHVVAMAVPFFTRIVQLRRLLGMGKEPEVGDAFNDQAGTLFAIGEIIAKHWAGDHVVDNATCRYIAAEIANLLHIERK